MRNPISLNRFMTAVSLVVALCAVPSSAATLVTTIPVGQQPAGIATNPVTHRIYAVNSSDATVSVIDAATNAVITTVPLVPTSFPPLGIGVNALTNQVYVAAAVINGSTNAVTTTPDTGFSVSGGIAVDPIANRTYFVDFLGSRVSVLDGASNTVVATIEAPGEGAYGIDVNPVTHKGYVSTLFTNSVLVFDTVTSMVTGSIAMPSAAKGVAVDSLNNRIYVSLGDGTVGVIDGATHAVISSISGVGVRPNAIAVNSGASHLYVVDEETSVLSVINTQSAAVVSTVATGAGPAGVTFDASLNTIYVSNQGGNTVSVFSDPAQAGFSAFLHAGACTAANPSGLTLDGVAPTASTAVSRDSTKLKLAGGNTWKEIGTWSGTTFQGTLNALESSRLWLGLTDNADTGARFDVRVVVRRNNTVLTTGEARCIQGLVKSPLNAKEVSVSLGSFSPVGLNGAKLSVQVYARMGTNGSGQSCGGSSSAHGLRLYFDAAHRASQLAGFAAP